MEPRAVDMTGAVESILDTYTARQEASMKALTSSLTESLTGLSDVFSTTLKEFGSKVQQSLQDQAAIPHQTTSNLQVPGDNTEGNSAHQEENRNNLLVPGLNARQRPADQQPP